MNIQPDASAHPTAHAFCLRLLTGPLTGSGWSITEQPLLIGRGLGCPIRFDDPAVSRQQCEVTQEAEVVTVRNLSQRQPTRVNSAPVTTCALQLGDVIEVGQHRIVVDVMVNPVFPEITEETTEFFTPLGGTALGIEGQLDASPLAAGSDLAVEIRVLMRLIKFLPEIPTLDAFAEALHESLRDELGAEACWLARQLTEGIDVIMHPPLSRDAAHPAPLSALKEACRLGDCVTVHSSEQERLNILIAPFMHHDQPLGALGIKLDVSDAEAEQRMGRQLCAIADAVSPLLVMVETLERLRRTQPEPSDNSQTACAGILGNSLIMTDLRGRIQRVARTRANVLIVGETGVGKELVAQAIHSNSGRESGPFVAINCAAVPPDLFESVMFGHERGSFTGAFAQQVGLMEQAHGGTLFLDEIGDLSLPNQARILRAVETGSFRRIGAKADLTVDTRIVSATNRTLPDPSQSYFRNDLYHRLATITLHAPPLREHPEDIPQIAQHFLDRFWADAPHHPRAFTGAAIALMRAFHWPGNVRELRNMVERACYEATGPVITDTDLGIPGIPASLSPLDASKPLEELERSHLIALLKKHQGKVAEVAQELRVSRGTVYYKLARLGIVLKESKLNRPDRHGRG